MISHSLCNIFPTFSRRYSTVVGRYITVNKGYRSSIATTLHQCRSHINLGTDRTLSDLIRSFDIERPITSAKPPAWNLVLVLYALLRQPYEPLGLASLKHLTHKTVFLVALASGRRRSEIHALSRGLETYFSNRTVRLCCACFSAY